MSTLPGTVVTGTITISADLFERLVDAAIAASIAADYIGSKGDGDKYRMAWEEAKDAEYLALFVGHTMTITFPETDLLPAITYGKVSA